MTNPAAAADIDRFLNEHQFSGYQSVPLPHGREIPGRDRSTEMRTLLDQLDVAGRTVLDVGTYYGALPATAAAMGAIATGLEPDPERCQIATGAAALTGDAWSIRPGSVEALGPDDTFDVVLLLNVIHHIDEPIAFLRSLARHCTGTLVVEFPVAHDISAVRYVWDDIDNSGKRPSPLVVAKTYFWSMVLRLASRRIPIALLGQHEYHRRWHFSTASFRVIAEQMIPGVASVSIERSTWNRYRAVAKLTMG